MRELKSIEEKILDKALYLFGKHGTTSVPIRAIVKEAGVNVSAINYYFGSKDRMLRYVKEFYLENISQAYAPLYDDKLSDEEKLIDCANEIIEYSLRYPGVLIMNKQSFSSDEKDELEINIVEKLKLENNKLDCILKKVIKNNGEEFNYKRIIFMSSIIAPTNDQDNIYNKEIMDNYEKRINYIKALVRLLKANK